MVIVISSQSDLHIDLIIGSIFMHMASIGHNTNQLQIRLGYSTPPETKELSSCELCLASLSERLIPFYFSHTCFFWSVAYMKMVSIV